MGCYSYICNISKKNVQEGEAVYLFLLKDGKVIEEQYGNYDLYGNVEGHEWRMDHNDVCNLHFSGHLGNGIAAIRAVVYNGEIPTVKSFDDPKQGTGHRKITKVESGASYHKIVAEKKSNIDTKLSNDSSLYLALLDTHDEIKKKYPLGNGHIQTIGDRIIFLEMLDKHGFVLSKKQK